MMRTAMEIRERALETLHGMLLRPHMYAIGTGREFEVTAWSQLQDLAFIDSREGELARVRDDLEAAGMFGPLGIHGALSAALRDESDHTARLASICAWVAARFGYFVPARRLTAAEWSRTRNVRAWAKARPRSLGDVEERFGSPSFKGSGQWPRCFAYAGPSDDAWLYFDFDVNHEHPRLECVRLPVSPFKRSIVDLRSKLDEVPPEEAYREFLVASLFGDPARILPLVATREDPTILCSGAYPEDVAQLLAQSYQAMDVIRVPAPIERVFLVSDGCGVPLAMVREGSMWRVDADPLIRIRRQNFSATTK